MDTKNITYISELDPNTDDHTMKLCMVRLWHQPMRGNPEKTYSIEMILMDEKGDKIQGNVLNRLVDHFKSFLQQGSVLYVYRPTLRENQSNYKYVKHDYKLGFVFPTKVKKCNDFTRSIYGFDFAEYQAIIDGAYDVNDYFGTYLDGAHGQLYVALSRVKSRKGLKMLILDKDGRPTNTTSNVVYKEVFSNL